MLHEVRLEDRERLFVRLLSAVAALGKLRNEEVIENFDTLEIARDKLSKLMDKAEGK